MRSSILTSKRAKALRRALTQPELMLWTRLRRRLPDAPVFRNQHPMGPYILDFYCPAAKLAVEIDGATHGEDEQIAHDERRDWWLKQQGVTVYRTSASSVFEDADQVADAVRLMADELIAARLASPVNGGGGTPAEEPVAEGTRSSAEPGLAPSTTPSAGRGPPPPLRRGGKT